MRAQVLGTDSLPVRCQTLSFSPRFQGGVYKIIYLKEAKVPWKVIVKWFGCHWVSWFWTLETWNGKKNGVTITERVSKQGRV